MNWLLAPLQYDFIIRALLAAVIVGVVCSVLGLSLIHISEPTRPY